MKATDTTSLISTQVLNELLNVACGTPPGAWLEVGVYGGGSALLLYGARGNRELHLFDTFTGLPYSDRDKGDTHDIGEFDGSWMLGTLLQKMPCARFHTGVFPATLPPDLTGVAFAHIDCDQYQSVTDCIVHLLPRMVPGGVMWFDDVGTLEGARRAVLEHFSEEQLQHAPEGRRYVIIGPASAR